MYFTYGSYTFPINSAIFTTDVQAVTNADGVPTGKKETWFVRGSFYGTSQTDLATKWKALQQALSIHYKDLVFHKDDGGVATALRNSASTSGVTIISGPSLTEDPVGFGWVNGLSFQFTAEASYVLTGVGGPITIGGLNLFELNETVEVFGGGALTGHIQPVNAPPIKQMVYAATPFRASQNGSASGPIPYPGPLPPLFPGAEVRPNRRTRFTPKRGDQGIRVFETSWSYEFESVGPLLGFPHQLAG